jgi:hypothetical protein
METLLTEIMMFGTAGIARKAGAQYYCKDNMRLAEHLAAQLLKGNTTPLTLKIIY